VAPAYEEHDPPDANPVGLVREHARGKALSVHEPGRVTLGVDTTVHLDGRVYGKAPDEEAATGVLRELAGRAHEVVSGLCLLTDRSEDVEHEATRVRFRRLDENEIRSYVASGEWRSRAGGYAIQGLGARLVEAVEGDYLNVVGLPGALLVELLRRRAPSLLG